MVKIRKLLSHEVTAAGRLIALGMIDNPIHLATWGEQSVRRQALYHSFVESQRSSGKWALGLFEDERLIGVAGVGDHSTAPPAAPSPSLLAMLSALDASAAPAYCAWRAAWGRHDPAEGHLHFGPFTVHPDRRRQGLGSLILDAFCNVLDAAGLAGYLEADQLHNVPLYQRHDYHVVHDEEVLGVRTWYMWRAARARHADLDATSTRAPLTAA